ncbi:hypothetical protein [Halarcobacter sp.]|uniref:hypothetical protein n=1 Tax=Halarcobacter sp. TaxID=2321133 RepID=UPI002AA7A1B2|nr:hypothetical protein [Halarcobacter sp.]
MKIEELIISELVYSLQKRLTKNTIEDLQKQNVKVFSDKKNECIDNFWEELCISVQDKTVDKHKKEKIKSFLFENLEKTFESLLLYEKIAFWLKSENGTLWLYENKDKSFTLEFIPYSFEECKDILFNIVINEANSFVNDNIYEYINLFSNTFEEEIDEDDKLIVYE